MALRYEIEDETNAVRIYYPDSDAPSLFQPDYPNTDHWENKEAATAWALLYISSVEDEAAPYAPSGPGIAGEAKPTPEEIAAMKAKM